MIPGDAIVLDNGVLRAEISATRGGSVLRLDALEDGDRPILRPWQGTESPADRAMFVMLPWCNRISGGGFAHEDRFHPLAPNLPAQDMPIHGTGLLRAWSVASRSSDSLKLTVSDKTVPPFAFDAQLEYRLEGDRFAVTLSVRHEGDTPAPYGLGFHPWFSWTCGDLLAFRAPAFAQEDDRHLPMRIMNVTEGALGGCRAPCALPETPINQTYLDWDGPAEIVRPDGSAVRIRASGAATHLHVFARGNGGDFVCLEPVSHTTDAVNRPLHASALPEVLNKGRSLSAALEIIHVRAPSSQLSQAFRAMNTTRADEP